jgi:glycerophosphoryl diester phosphodiesterase
MHGIDWLTARPIAHRGLHDPAAGVIENTASAVIAAVSSNYAIEVDLQVTADGEAVVHHDDRLGRLTEGEARIDGMTAAELKDVRFRSTADRMMTLTNLLDLVAGRVGLLLELKSHFDGDPRLARRVAAALEHYPGPVAAMSFDPVQMIALRDLLPALPRGIVAERHPGPASPRKDGRAKEQQRGPLTPRRLGLTLAALSSRPHFLAYNVRDLPAMLPLMARSLLGMPVLAWTVRTREEHDCARRWANQIIFEGFRP